MQSFYPPFIPMPYRRPVTGMLLGVLVLILLYFIAKRFNILPSKKGAEEVPIDRNSPLPKSGFNATNEAVKIKTLLGNTWDGLGEDVQAFEIILAYNDNELKEVHNAWLQKYRGQRLDTLRKQVDAEVIAFYRTDVVGKKKGVLERLNKLGL